SPISCAERPSPLPVSGKSSAMRGGLLIANPAGGLASGAFKVNLTTVRPELPLDTVSPSMLLPACASAWPIPRITRAAPKVAAPPQARQLGRFNVVDGTGLRQLLELDFGIFNVDNYAEILPHIIADLDLIDVPVGRAHQRKSALAAL